MRRSAGGRRKRTRTCGHLAGGLPSGARWPDIRNWEVREMRNAETVLGVLRERGRRHWPLERVYRLLFNRELYLLAYGRIYSNKGAMTPGVTGETADGMSMEKIERIIDALRHERYRFSPVRRVWIPKKNGSAP